MKTTEEKIAVMQAAEKGKTIQCKPLDNGTKWETTGRPLWNWHSFDYRVSPEDVSVHVYRRKDTGELSFKTDPVLVVGAMWQYLGAHTLTLEG